MNKSGRERLQSIRDRVKKEQSAKVTTVTVGMGSCSIAAGSEVVMKTFIEEIEHNGIEDVIVRKVGCRGMCSSEPTVEVCMQGIPTILYGQVTEGGAKKIVHKHILQRRLVNNMIFDDPGQATSKKVCNSYGTETAVIIFDNEYGSQDYSCDDIFKDFSATVIECKLDKDVQIVKAAEKKHYTAGCLVRILPDNAFLCSSKGDVDDIIDNAIVRKEEIATLAPLDEGCTQKKIVLRNAGRIDPESIEDAIVHAAYVGLEKALFESSPEEIIEEMKVSGLRGRGGGGYHTWKKWSDARQQDSDTKYIICNCDEGDPGSFKDRSIVESDPHTIIEAMVIAGYAIGAQHGIIYIRGEYALAVHRLQQAIREAEELGLLGEDILGSGFTFRCNICLGTGAFVCGEETGLIACVEGRRGMPRPRPPYPSTAGLYDAPTIINNVETLANIPAIVGKGGEWFSSIGTKSSTGTKVLSLSGKLCREGLVEVPMGTPLRNVIAIFGGGIRNGKRCKAVQTGGPSGGVITEENLDVPIDFDDMAAKGSMLGSGGIIAIDDDDCIIDTAKFYLKFAANESCGKCPSCRIGSKTLLHIFEKIAAGESTPQEKAQIFDLCKAMKKGSLCGLGTSTPNPIISLLSQFESEFLAHIDDKRCPAHRCRALITYSILANKCIGCTMCARSCPVDAISGEIQKVHVIDQEKCIRCGECFKACKFGAIERQ